MGAGKGEVTITRAKMSGAGRVVDARNDVIQAYANRKTARSFTPTASESSTSSAVSCHDASHPTYRKAQQQMESLIELTPDEVRHRSTVSTLIQAAERAAGWTARS